MNSPRDELLADKARTLRNDPTAAERVLWFHLRRGQMAGAKFRRQQPIGPFIVDFYCSALRVVVELDGSSHDNKEPYDLARQQYLESKGLTVLRFTNSDIRENVVGVAEQILGVCRDLKGGCAPPPNPRPQGVGGSGMASG
jgi:very-short-patch-repair endonuclease